MGVDIIDRIDELVDAQLANYDNRSGYDRNINQDKCWHCGGEWHGLAITQKILTMRASRMYSEDYKYADDDSPVICPGSDFIGPLPCHGYEDMLCRAQHAPVWLDELIEATTAFVSDCLGLPSFSLFNVNDQIDAINLAIAGFQPIGHINGDDQ